MSYDIKVATPKISAGFTMTTISFAGLQRTFTGGCYDPIVRSPTLHAPCLADRHCDHMPHTRCSESALSTLKLTAFGTSGHPSDRVCVCDDNAVAKPRDKGTGAFEVHANRY